MSRTNLASASMASLATGMTYISELLDTNSVMLNRFATGGLQLAVIGGWFHILLGSAP